MNTEKDDLDKILDEKISHIQFEYKESYWTEMEALLSKQNRSFGILWWGSSIAFLSMLLLILFYPRIHSQYYPMDNQLVHSMVVKNSAQPLHKVSNTPVENVAAMVVKGNKFNHRVSASKSDIHNVKNLTAGRQNFDESKLSNATEKHFNKVSKIENVYNPEQKNDFSENLVAELDETNIEREKNMEVEPNTVETLPIRTLPEAFSQGIFPALQTLTNLKPTLSHYLVLEFGAGYGTNAFSATRCGGEVAHIGLVYRFEKRNWGLKTGVNTSWSSVKGLNYMQRQKVYGFSSSVVSSGINYRSIVNLEIPLELSYHLKKHFIGLGLKAGILLSTISKTKNWTDISMSAKTQWNYVDGLCPISASIMADYAFQIAKRWTLGAQFSYNLTSLTSKRAINLVNLPLRQFQAQFIVQYDLNIFKK
jgi:hypothetical protein